MTDPSIRHYYDPCQQCHHIIIEKDAICLAGYRPNSTHVPLQLVDEALDLFFSSRLKVSKEADLKRLRHFKHKFGPQFTLQLLPRGI